MQGPSVHIGRSGLVHIGDQEGTRALPNREKCARGHGRAECGERPRRATKAGRCASGATTCGSTRSYHRVGLVGLEDADEKLCVHNHCMDQSMKFDSVVKPYVNVCVYCVRDAMSLLCVRWKPRKRLLPLVNVFLEPSMYRPTENVRKNRARVWATQRVDAAVLCKLHVSTFSLASALANGYLYPPAIDLDSVSLAAYHKERVAGNSCRDRC